MGDGKDVIPSNNALEKILKEYPDISVLGYEEIYIFQGPEDYYEYEKFMIHILNESIEGTDLTIPVISHTYFSNHYGIYFTPDGIEYSLPASDERTRKMLEVAYKGLQILKVYKGTPTKDVNFYKIYGRVLIPARYDDAFPVDVIDTMIEYLKKELGYPDEVDN